MNRIMAHAGLALFSASLIFGSAGAASASEVFDFQFDNQGTGTVDGTIVPPLTGTGTFTFANNVGLGIFALSALGVFQMDFTFGADSYTEANIATPLSEVAVRIIQDGANQRLEFTENGSPADGGPAHGALDLENGTLLSFEPSFFGGNYLYAEGPVNLGSYLALARTSAPEPLTLSVFGVGLVGAAAMRRRKKV
jgi:PEP-CTERM motif